MALNLPPGVYNIQTPGGKNVVCPVAPNIELKTAAPDSSAYNQQWLIAPNGVIMSMVNVPNSFAFVPDGADQGNVMAAQVAVNWIITANPVDPIGIQYVGKIGNGVAYWGLDDINGPAEKVILFKIVPPNFNFVPVPAPFLVAQS